MAIGYKTGGRQIGTPNADKKELLEMIAERYPDYHPVMAMVELANNPEVELLLKFHANKEVAKYVCPQLKSIELQNKEAMKFRVRLIERQSFKTGDQGNDVAVP